jgi:trk system potassium uptake protein
VRIAPWPHPIADPDVQRISQTPFYRALNPGQLVALSFAVAIAVGTLILALPVSHRGSGEAPVKVALFTATAAICVTSHTLVDTTTYWTPFGQVVILVLIQLGGFAIMTAASMIFLVLGRRLGLRGRLISQRDMEVVNLEDARRVFVGLAAFTVAVELIIGLAICLRLWLGLDYPFLRALWRAIFLSISAFNNAGFALWSGNLARFSTDWWILIPVAIAVLIGGIGFPVWLDVRRRRSAPRTWTLHSKLTLTTTTALIFGGALVMGLMEWTNPRTLHHMNVANRIGSTLFASINFRTSGFTTLPIDQMHSQTRLIGDMLMFVGGGSGSTAGGLKLATFAVLVLIVLSEVRGGRQAEAFGRAIPSAVLRQSISVAFIAVSVVLFATLAFMMLTPFGLDDCLFEAVSSFANVGLTTGITAHMGTAAQLIEVALMYLGRIGPLTLAVALTVHERDRLFSYPEERPLVG